MEAPRDVVHNQAFNIGRTDENFQISTVADMVAEIVPNSRVVYEPGGEPDTRSYKVDFSKLSRFGGKTKSRRSPSNIFSLKESTTASTRQGCWRSAPVPLTQK
jgi:nucleoside-diphosphate-sugar epimerase